MSHAAVRATIAAVARVLALALPAACLPLPIPHTAQVTPAVVGTLRRADGTPVAGTPVAVTGEDKDVACARTGRRGVTDSFRLPAARERRRIFWLTMFENFGTMGYWLCAGAADSAAAPAAGPANRTYLRGRMAGDTLTCVAWTWRARPRVTCKSSGHRWSCPRATPSRTGARGSRRGVVGDV